MFDLGASLWNSGGSGPTQSFMINSYRARGISAFDRTLMWEAIPHSAQEIFDGVPYELHAAYQYINLPVVTGRRDARNPLNVLKQIMEPEDFVVLKLDIDMPRLENDLISQMLDEPEISSRIDELFYEHHVNFKPYLFAWETNFDPNMTLGSSNHVFTELRKRGVRSHGWP